MAENWTPSVPPTTQQPVQPVLNNSLSDNEFIQIGLSLVIVSLVLAIYTAIRHGTNFFQNLSGGVSKSVEMTRRKLSFGVSFRNWSIELWSWIAFILVLFICGITLIGVEKTATSLNDLKEARKNEQITFSVFFTIILIALATSFWYTESYSLIPVMLVYLLCFVGIIMSVVVLSNVSLDIQNQPMFFWGMLVMLLGIGISVPTIYGRLRRREIPSTQIVVGGVLGVLGFILTMIALSQKNPSPQGEPIPQLLPGIFPNDLVCNNITGTVTNTYWTNISRFRMMVNVRYLPPSGDPQNPFLPMVLVSGKNSSGTPVLTVTYRDKKLIWDILDNKGSTISIPIDVVPNSSGMFYVSMISVFYSDVSGKKVGSISIIDEGNPERKVSENTYDRGSPGDWGWVTLEIFKNKANNNAPVVEGAQLCTEKGFSDIPLWYKICTGFVYVIFTLIAIWILSKVPDFFSSRFN